MDFQPRRRGKRLVRPLTRSPNLYIIPGEVSGRDRMLLDRIFTTPTVIPLAYHRLMGITCTTSPSTCPKFSSLSCSPIKSRKLWNYRVFQCERNKWGTLCRSITTTNIWSRLYCGRGRGENIKFNRVSCKHPRWIFNILFHSRYLGYDIIK